MQPVRKKLTKRFENAAADPDSHFLSVFKRRLLSICP